MKFWFSREEARSCRLYKLLGGSCSGCNALGSAHHGKDSQQYVNCPCFGEPDYSIVANTMGWSMKSERLDQLLESKRLREEAWIVQARRLSLGYWNPSRRELQNLLELRRPTSYHRLRQPAPGTHEEARKEPEFYQSKFLDSSLDFKPYRRAHTKEGSS